MLKHAKRNIELTDARGELTGNPIARIGVWLIRWRPVDKVPDPGSALVLRSSPWSNNVSLDADPKWSKSICADSERPPIHSVLHAKTTWMRRQGTLSSTLRPSKRKGQGWQPL